MPASTRSAPLSTDSKRSESLRGARYWAPGIATAIVVPILLLALMEGALRLFGVGFSTGLTEPCNLQGHPASCYNLFFPAPFFPPGMIKTPQAYAIPAEKPQGTYRIFVLGESAAMGDPDPAYAFSRYLEVMLRERYPSMKFEVVNTGSVAINSHVLLPIARGLANQKPDLFIIYSGNNEVVGPYGPGTALTASGMSLPVIRASIFFHSTRIGQLLTKVGTRKREWGGMAMFLDKQVRESSPLMQYAYQNFERNLRDTIATARDAGARVLVSTVAINLKDCAPFGSLHREGLTPDDLHAWTALLQQGTDLENARSYAEAMKAYLAASKIDDQYAELEFRMARSLRMLGDYTGAKQHFARARDLDTLRFRADSKINDINRSTAASSGAELVDADDVLSKQSPNGIIGGELVYEHVHLTPLGNYLLARAMFLQVASKLPFQSEHPVSESDVLSETECEQLLAFTAHDRSRIAAEMLERLEKPPFTNQVNHSDQLLRLTLQTQDPGESPNDTAAEYEWAIRKNPNDRVLHYNYGLFLFDYNRTAAVDQLRLSRPWDGFPVFAPDGTIVE
ncbi:MAG TPA: tetratricopeptide repeat protein [Candidatus Sulfotelmatobacter sp.]|nr:tetratricopeptide repeat protein [Candidatus Sulfotelmatobacter sp.]